MRLASPLVDFFAARGPTRHSTPSRFGLSIVIVFALAACTSGSTASSTTIPSTGVSASSVASAVRTDAPSVGPKVLQTDTAWGRIWDGLPSGFPLYPGATPDQAAAGGPASAVFVVTGHGAKDVAAFLQTKLQKTGFTAVGSSEPLEDGSVVLDMTGAPHGCMLQVTVKPTGALTSVTVLYGAACPQG